MKKQYIAALLALCAAVSLAGQEAPDVPALTMLNVNGYSSFFLDTSGKLSGEYGLAAADEDYKKIAALSGVQTSVDTNLEIALLSCSPGVVDIRPAEAGAMLPKDNPRLSGLKLGAAVYKELVELKFLDPQNAAAIGRYEDMLAFIIGRTDPAGVRSVSLEDIDAYFRQGIGLLVAETVDTKFNTISFLLHNSTTNPVREYNSVLTRDAKTGRYTLSYGGTYTNNKTRIITAGSPEALLSEMRQGRYKDDFDQTDIDAVRGQAALIPAVVLGAQSMDDIRVILTYFYLSPNAGTYRAVKEVYLVYYLTALAEPKQFWENTRDAYYNTLVSLNPLLAQKVIDDARGSVTASLSWS
jgi:hypothetical protein